MYREESVRRRMSIMGFKRYLEEHPPASGGYWYNTDGQPDWQEYDTYNVFFWLEFPEIVVFDDSRMVVLRDGPNHYIEFSDVNEVEIEEVCYLGIATFFRYDESTGTFSKRIASINWNIGL